MPSKDEPKPPVHLCPYDGKEYPATPCCGNPENCTGTKCPCCEAHKA